MSAQPDVNAEVTRILNDRGVAVDDFTKKIHAIKFRFPLFRRPGNPIGMVMHNTDGMITLPNLVGHWTKKPFPSHFAIAQEGRVGRYVMLDFADRATEGTLRHVSIEFQAVRNGDITSDQIKSAAIIAGFLHTYYGTELAVANSKSEKGLAHHSLFVDPKNPDGHGFCPGKAIIAHKPEILDQAKKIAAELNFPTQPAGRWRVQVHRWTWIYDFDANGTVRWTDPFNKQTGTGTWRLGTDSIVFAWAGSATKEHWDLPLAPAAQTGRCAMSEGTYAVNAVKL